MIKNFLLALLLGTAIMAGAKEETSSIGNGTAGWNWAQNVEFSAKEVKKPTTVDEL